LLFLKGDKYTDPIDGKSFKSMLPYGYEKQQCASPSTLSLERHRFVFYLNEQTDFFYSAVLHFAPEQAFTNCFAIKT
jgi:hypothetical protein